MLCWPYPVYFGTHIRCTLGSMKLELSSNISNPTQRFAAADDFGKSWTQCDNRLVSYPTLWSFIFGFLNGSYDIYLWYISSSKQQRNIVQLCTSRPQENPVTPKNLAGSCRSGNSRSTDGVVGEQIRDGDWVSRCFNQSAHHHVIRCFCLSLFSPFFLFVFLAFWRWLSQLLL